MIGTSVSLDPFENQPGPVTYTLTVRSKLQRKPTTLSKRFRDFDKLHMDMDREVSQDILNFSLPQLPQKHGVWRTSQALNERAQNLDEYLATLIAHCDVASFLSLADFLGIQRSLWPLACAPTADEIGNSITTIQSAYRGRVARRKFAGKRRALTLSNQCGMKKSGLDVARESFIMRCFMSIFG